MLCSPQREFLVLSLWRDSALQNGIAYKPNSTTTYTTTYNYGSTGISRIDISDGTPRKVYFITDPDGRILVRDETTGPSELHYHFNGQQIGDVGNNGTSDIDYIAELKEHTAPAGTGAYRGGATSAIKYADFDQSYDPINGYKTQSTASSYTVQDGDTLESIAQNLWGDSSYWYLIADANGLDGTETLIAGQTLTIPDKFHNSHNSPTAYRVYDPNEAIGDNSPTHAPLPTKHGGGRGVVGMILLVVVAVVVTALTEGALAAPMASLLGGSELAGGLAAAAIGGAAGSLASQGVGLALGMQDRLNWNAVGTSAIAAVVGGGGTGNFVADVAIGAAANALTQGISIAVGLQKKFDWVSVAAAGIGNGAVNWAAGELGGVDFGLGQDGNRLATRAVSGMAGAIANAATRSLINGTDFGDNIMASIPDVIGQTIGNLMVGKMFPPTQSGTQNQPQAAARGGNSPSSDSSETIDDIINKYAAEYEASGTPGIAALGSPISEDLTGATIHDEHVDSQPLPPIPSVNELPLVDRQLSALSIADQRAVSLLAQLSISDAISAVDNNLSPPAGLLLEQWRNGTGPDVTFFDPDSDFSKEFAAAPSTQAMVQNAIGDWNNRPGGIGGVPGSNEFIPGELTNYPLIFDGTAFADDLNAQNSAAHVIGSARIDAIVDGNTIHWRATNDMDLHSFFAGNWIDKAGSALGIPQSFPLGVPNVDRPLPFGTTRQIICNCSGPCW